MSSIKLALLVIDMQEHFRDIGKSIIPNLNAVIKSCRSSRIPIIFTQHGHRYLDCDVGSLGRFWGVEDMIRYGSKNWEILKELENIDSDYKIIEKRRYDAFYGTVLQDMLLEMQVDTVIISGVMTNLCCETTARSAFVRGFNIVFLSDGCATSDAKGHEATLYNIKYGFGEVLPCKDFIEKYCKLC